MTTRVTDMSWMFYQNPSFNQDIANWDTSNVTDMRVMFHSAQSFNQPLNNWDTSKVTDMSTMFLAAIVFNQPLNNWDTSKVTTMRSMFDHAQSFNQPLNNWDTSNVTDMSRMFEWARAFNQPLNNWDTSKVTNMWGMFHLAQSFNQPLNNWDTSKVINMRGMFAQAIVFNQPLNNWDTSKVTDMSYMFFHAQSFNQPLNNRRINQIWDENLKVMFNNATAFKANQPYCSWANWSAKKWNFVNMGLNDCINGQCKDYPWNHTSQPATNTANGCVAGDYQDIADDANNWKWKCNGKYWGTSTECSAAKQSTCPSGFTANNGKCVKWKCENTPASSSPARCEKKSNYKYIETEGYRFIESELGRVSWQVACDTMEEQGYNPSEAFMLRVTCPLLWYWLYDSLSRNEWHFTWWFDTWNRKMSVKVPSGTPFGILNPNAYIESDFLYDPTAMSDHLIQEYLNSQHTGNPYRGIVLNENQKEIHFCENLDFNKRHIPIFSAQTDYRGKRYPMCQENTDCTSKNQSQCNSLSKICKRIAWTTTPASTKSICVDDQWNTIPDSFCTNAWPKPSCTSLVNGQCKIHAWTSASQPATATANGCIAGEYEDIPDDTTNWKWKCNGKNWGTETMCSAPKGATNPLDRKPWTVRFIVNCPDYISAIQIEWISKTPNEGPRYDDYYIDLPLVNSSGEMPTSEYPWLKRWYPVLNKTFDNAVRKITIVRDNPAPWKWWAYQINLPSHLIPQNLQEGGRYDIPTMSCLRSGEA